MGKHWLIYLAALGGAVVFHAYYFGWYSWFILVMALCLPGFSLVVSFLAMVRMRLYLDAPPCCSRGDQIFISLRSSNGFLPMPQCRFRLTVTSVMTGQVLSMKQHVPGQDNWYVPLDTSHCGTLVCAVEKARVYDYLGLFRFPVRLPKPVEVQIRPVPTPPEKLPNLAQFLARRRQPKSGGGFSEEHDMRDYHPGDSMRDIHWKLSVKTDRLIVREPQEPIRGLTLLTFDLLGTPERVDATLERLVWMSQWLLDHETPHRILWIDPTDCQIASAAMENRDNLQELVERLLRTPLRPDTPSIANRRFASASWRYHIQPEQEEAS